MLLTACAPAVPKLPNAPGASPAAVVTTTVAPVTATPTTTTRPSTTTSTTTTTTLAPEPTSLIAGAWSIDVEVRDESGDDFVAEVSAPAINADVDAALLGRVTTLVAGHVEAQIGATLALWRSIEQRGERDLSGSRLTLVYEIAGFTEELLSVRFFSDEQVAGSGGVKRQVTTLMVDLESGVAVGLDDIVFSGESRVSLLSLVQAGLLTDYFEGDEESYALWAANISVNDLDRAVLTPDGLEIWFDELEVGPPSIGMPVVALAYEELTDILDPAGPASVFLSTS